MPTLPVPWKWWTQAPNVVDVISKLGCKYLFVQLLSREMGENVGYGVFDLLHWGALIVRALERCDRLAVHTDRSVDHSIASCRSL